MRRPFAYAIALVLVLLVAPSASQAQWSRDDDITQDELRRFDRFLDDHPEVERDLARQPGLATDRRYLADHPGLRDFLGDHPGIREELRNNPRRFLRAEQRFDRFEDRRFGSRDLDDRGFDDRSGRRPLDRDQLVRLDRFLDDHPEVAHDLRSNPWIVNDRRYLAEHPGFRDFLGDHPIIRQELRENPHTVLNQEREFDRHDEHHDGHGPQRRHGKHD